ncbi:MAG: NifB/NifX family molybdenum-iron cluster-binding protein [Candidatus Omnitrophica bacterium]|nr:NifB/NifX family molybdenum-iron cluster-binding protein [Candidatus Omnitrophota bacterium]
MKVAISTDNDQVSAHFGRCPSFTIIDIEDGKVIKQDIIENPGHEPGRIPEFLNKKGVQHIIAGGMGMRATGFFQEYGIKTIVGVQGTISDVIKELQDGTLKGGESLCKPGGGKGYGLDKIECDHPHEETECEHDGGEK